MMMMVVVEFLPIQGISEGGSRRIETFQYIFSIRESFNVLVNAYSIVSLYPAIQTFLWESFRVDIGVCSGSEGDRDRGQF